MSDLKERQEIKDKLVTDRAMALACDEDGLNIYQRKLVVELCHIIERHKANESRKSAEQAFHKHIVTNRFKAGNKIVVLDDDINKNNDGKTYTILRRFGNLAILWFRYNQKFELRFLRLDKHKIILNGW